MKRQDYYIAGMDCAEEVGALETELSKVSGIESTAFDVLRSRMSVTFDEAKTSDKVVREAVAKTGMRADTWSEEHTEKRADKGRVHAMTASALLLVSAVVLHTVLFGWRHLLGQDEDATLVWWIILLYIGSAIAGAWFVIPRAISAARSLRPDMNLLMTLAVAGALLIGEWFEAASVSFLFAASLALERWSVGRARKAVEALMSLTPDEARVRDDKGRDVTLPVENVEVGRVAVVLPGERIPLDGTVIAGTSWVNQAPVTGESIPVAREPGDDVFAGSINGDGVLEIKVRKIASESLLAKVAKLVEEARQNRSGHEKWVDAFARIYTPIVLLIALAILILSPLLFDVSWASSFYNALVLLVIACPCALVISTPVSMVAALASAARHGVLIKGAVHVESPSKLETIALDKTGTITKNELQVVNVVPVEAQGRDQLLKLAVALEQRSSHPLALAILQYAAEQGVQAEPADDLQNFPGKGAEGTIAGKKYWIGSHRFLEERQQETAEAHQELVELASGGASVVVVGSETGICGYLALKDVVHPEAKSVMKDLHSLGISRIVMLTGDNKPTAEAIALEAGIDEVQSELLPENKSDLVASLVQESRGGVAMVGDGVNDAPAMAAATVGIAMGGKGTDVAIETADIVLMTDNLQRLPWLVRLSRRSVAIIRQNIVMALLSKAIFVVLAALGMATLWMAITADMGVSLLAVFNALRLLHQPGEEK